MNKQHRIDFRVYIEDTDAYGIVYYANYLKFYERARTELFRELGYNKVFVSDFQRVFVVKHIDVSYQSPAHLDDIITLATSLITCKNASVSFRQTVHRQQQLLCDSVIQLVCVDAVHHTIRAIPQTMHDKIMSLGDNTYGSSD